MRAHRRHAVPPPGGRRRTERILIWVDEFLETAIAKDLADFPRREEYIPEPGSLQ